MEATDAEVAKRELFLAKLQKIASQLGANYDKHDLSDALHRRSVYIGYLTELAFDADKWYYAKAAELSDVEKGFPEWKFKVAIENSLEGRISRFRKQIFESLRLQTEAITTELIERQSDRKHASGQG